MPSSCATTSKLELSKEKTLITHARTQAARFLGYEITVAHDDRKLTRGQRERNGTVQLRVPKAVIKAKSAPYLKRGKPASRPALKDRDDHAIIGTYGAEYRGIVQYYLLAVDVWRLDRLQWVMETSMLKTLAHRHRSTVTKMARKYKAVTVTPHGRRRCFEAQVERPGRKPLVARFGGIPLKRQKRTAINDRPQGPARPRQKELVTRLLTGQCEWCGQAGPVEAHQVRKLADLARKGQPQPEWARIMARRQRKTLIVCAPCHAAIHTGTQTASSAAYRNDQGELGEPPVNEPVTVEAVISHLPPRAARMAAIEILLNDPAALGDDTLESALYILREKLRAAQ